MAQILDAATKIPADAIVANGYAGVLRYVAPYLNASPNPKCITAEELRADFAANLLVGIVFEQGAQNALGGTRQGTIDGIAALASLRALGLPPGGVVYAAVDFDAPVTSWPTIAAYLDGFRDSISPDFLIGGYGKAALGIVMLNDGHARAWWESGAWSGDARISDSRASLYQRIGQVTVGGVTCDVNDVWVPDWGQWPRQSALSAASYRTLPGMLPLDAARPQLGYVEGGGPNGRSGNITKFWDWWDAIANEHDQGASWCGAFVSWAFDASGHRLPAMDSHHGPGFIYCPQGEQWFRGRGLAGIAKDAQPNDIAFFDFQESTPPPHHTAIVESINLHRQTITCIEGNTSSGVSGSQSNGGGVYRRVRPWSQVHAIGHTPWLVPKEAFVQISQPIKIDCNPTTGRGWATCGIDRNKVVAVIPLSVTGPDGDWVPKIGLSPNHAVDGEGIVVADIGPSMAPVSVYAQVAFNA